MNSIYKGGKAMQKWIILVVVCIIVILGGFVIFNSNIETEYTPEEEIREEELRNTLVSLYFEEKNTKELVKETRLIDSKRLLKNPYEELINMLIEGPQNNNYERIIPENTILLDATLVGNCVVINFSKEFVNEHLDIDKKNNLVNSILKTLSELTEVNTIKIMVEGNEFDIL